MPQKIAFIKIGPFSHTNKSVIEILERQFPNYELEIIDVQADLVNRRSWTNIFFTLREYGPEILLGKKKVRKCLLRTTHFFKEAKSAVLKRLSEGDFAFSFQTQSMFDASTPGLPHFVYTDHTHLANLHNPIFNRNNLYSRAWIELEKTIYHNATLNFTMSDNISQSIIEEYGCDPDKVVCIYAGSNAPNQNITIDPQKYNNKHILLVGVNWEMKGGPELAEAFKSVLEVHPDAKLTIVGCSPELDLPNCTVVGRVSLEEVSKYYEEASVFCLPTKTEALGIVFIEALNHKLPIVANNIEAVPNFVIDGETGYLVEPNDIQQLAKALIDLIGNPEKCRAFGERGYAAIDIEKYSWEKVGERMAAHIAPIINSQAQVTA